jgi:predicted dithiol-disulfide oxidoreductase (DUF899 family)
MTAHDTAGRAEWLAARLELLEAEKELTRHSDDVARRRRELPWVAVEKDYRFETVAGAASLADLFGGRSQLLVYHCMFGPEYTGGCLSCSAIADGPLPHVLDLRARPSTGSGACTSGWTGRRRGATRPGRGCGAGTSTSARPAAAVSPAAAASTAGW